MAKLNLQEELNLGKKEYPAVVSYGNVTLRFGKPGEKSHTWQEYASDLMKWSGQNAGEVETLISVYGGIFMAERKKRHKKISLEAMGAPEYFYPPAVDVYCLKQSLCDFEKETSYTFSQVEIVISKPEVFEIFLRDWEKPSYVPDAVYFKEQFGRKMKPSSVGLVLAGGGAKGAYQVGFLKEFLEEDSEFCGISGTSVGALNAAMYATMSPEEVEKIWSGISQEDLFDIKTILGEEEPDPHFFTDLAKAGKEMGSAAFYSAAYLEIFLREFMGKDQKEETLAEKAGRFLRKHKPETKVDLKKLEKKTGKAMTLLVNGIKNRAFFSRGAMEEIIRKHQVPEKLQKTKIPVYVTCHNKKNQKAESFLLNNKDAGMINRLLLASSAIPAGIYPSETVYGIDYCDGGTSPNGDNVPVLPLYEQGVRRFLVIHLRSAGETFALSKDDKDNLENYSMKFPEGGIFYHVFPSVDLGDLWSGTLDFTPEILSRHMEDGKKDAQKYKEAISHIKRKRFGDGKEKHFCSVNDFRIPYDSIGEMVDSFGELPFHS